MNEGHILLTGGNSDIGRCVVKAIRKELKWPIMVTKNSQNFSYSEKNIEEVTVDCNNRQEVESFAHSIEGLGISHYIQLQGNSWSSDYLDTQSFESLDYHLNINCLSTIIILRFLLPTMKQRKFGRICLMNTASSEHGGGESNFGYGLAKHSVGYTIKYLAKYYTSFNILSNCVSPGLIETKFHKRIKRTVKQIQKRAAMVRLGRPGTPQAVADLIYHITFKNSFISGENFKIDGADFS